MSFAVPASSYGTTLLTPMLFNQSGAQTTCDVVNVGTRPISVDMKLFDDIGNQVAGITASVAPEQGSHVTGTVSAGFGIFRYCTFTYSGSKNAVQAGMENSVGPSTNLHVDAH
jgi:hypothetical protein